MCRSDKDGLFEREDSGRKEGKRREISFLIYLGH